jgi:hypothetical protein
VLRRQSVIVHIVDPYGGSFSMSTARSRTAGVALVGLAFLAATAADAATISLSSITNNSTCVTANGDDGNDDEDPYNPSNAACSEPLGGSDSNFMRLSNSGTTSSGASPGGSTAIGFGIDAGVAVDSAVDGQDEYERGRIRYTLGFNVTATAVENWTVDLSQSVLGLFGFAGDGPATAVGTQVFGNAGISTIDVDVGASDVSFTAAPASASSNVANTGNQSFGPFSGSRNDLTVASGTGNGSFSVTISFDIDAFSNAGCTGFLCSSASGGEDAAVLMGYDNADDCCGGTVDRVSADNYGTWGRAVAPDGYNSTWTLTVTSNCGNSVINLPETCDEGVANGLSTSCCTSLCTLRTMGDICRPNAGFCDLFEVCDGVSGACPADGFEPTFVVCRAASGVCDATEFCTGGSANCPPDGVQPGGTPCRPGSGDICDPTETCNGVAKTCPGDVVSSAGTPCRTGSGDSCDVTETCTGTPATACPADDAPGNAGDMCRAGSGDSCDAAETCTGTPGAACPADDAPGNAGDVCRAGSGDSCDAAETCTGTPGATCPADDAPGNAGDICRPGSGDSCDTAETCTGTPGATCPADDAPGNAGEVCRPGSGDVCDAEETCTGTAGAACPADDAPGNAGNVCNPGTGDVCDPDETCTGTPGASCPTDTVSAAGTECRADAGACDVAETCGGTGDVPCPADGFVADGTGCSDGTFCNGQESCQSGACVDNADPCFASCDEGTDTCAAECPAAPLSNCRTSGRSILLLKDKTPDSKDRLLWKWVNGQATMAADFGEPATTTNYALCLYSGTTATLIADAEVHADSQTWTFIGGKGYRYLDGTYSQDGIQKILLKGKADADKSKILWKGKGDQLDDLLPGTLPLPPAGFPVTVQAVNNETPVCFESTFAEADVKSNRADQLKLNGSNP